METIDKFISLFSEFNLVIELITPQNTKPNNTNNTNPRTSIIDLKKKLGRLTKEYKQAQHSFKNNKITRQELFDFEWRIFEIQEDLNYLQGQGDNGEI